MRSRNKLQLATRICELLLTLFALANSQTSYTALRIVVRDSSNIDSLVMNTDQDTTLRVQGRRPDNGLWEPVAATWQVSPGLSFDSTPPANASAFSFSPAYPHYGWIRVTLGNDAVTRPDTVFTSFLGQPPTIVSVSYLAREEHQIAGDTSLDRLSIKEGGFPGPFPFCDSVVFRSNIASRPGQPAPYAIVNNARIPFDTKTPVCSDNGSFLIKVVLFNAPFSSNLNYVLDITFNKLGQLHDTFPMFPSAVSRLEVERLSDSASVDPVFLTYPTGSVMLTSVGYDAYGNKRGLELAHWSTTGSLHAITRPDSITRVFYDASTVTSDEEGFIHCSPGSNLAIQDSVKIKIAGQLAVVPRDGSLRPGVLNVMTADGVRLGIALPAGVAGHKLCLSLYSMSGKSVCVMRNISSEAPICLSSSLQPGIYIVSVKCAQRLLVNSRLVIMK
jgi:hypothetical protein